MEMKIIIFALMLTLVANTVTGQYHCTIPGERCVIGQGTCDAISGNCTCEEGFEGYNCGLATDSKCDASLPSPCENDGICYDTDKCFCGYEFFGDRCENKKVSTECMGTEVAIDIYVKDSFNGQIAMTQNLSDSTITDGTDVIVPECLFVEETTDPAPAGFKHFKFSLPFDGSSPCVNATLTMLEDIPKESDVTYETLVFQSFSKLFTTASDRMVTVQCTHKSSNFSMNADLDAVDLNRKKDVRQKQEDEIYRPVKFTATQMDGSKLTGPLNVGDKFKLFGWLSDTSVYTGLRIEACTANDKSKKDSPAIFQFIKNGCPVEEAAPIMQNIYGQELTEYTNEAGTVLPATDLGLKAFKFRGTKNVGFVCKIKICKRGEEEACVPKCGRGAGGAAAGGGGAAAGDLSGNGDSVNLDTSVRRKRDAGLVRRRRSTDTELEEFSTVITVIDPFENLPLEKEGPTTPATNKDDQQKCFRSQEILVFVIAMSSFVFILLIACIVLSISIIRTRNRLFSSEKDSDYSSSRFSIPRAKVYA